MSTAQEPQHLKALAWANSVRIRRADLKCQIKRGDITVSEILRDPPQEAETMSIEELLKAQERWGGRRAYKFLEYHQIRNSNRPVNALAERQRRRMADDLERRSRPDA